MDPTVVIPHYTAFSLFAVYTYVFSTGAENISFMFILDYALVSVQTASLLIFLIIHSKGVFLNNFGICLIKVFFIFLTLNLLMISIIGFSMRLDLSIDEIKLFVTRLIVACLELSLFMKFGIDMKPRVQAPPSPPMSKPPSYSTFEAI